ncbi:alpha/beta fold hydrolase [Spirosoma flavum]|uniref:Alpha/beta fold hydrolase n=1 Tax=Spirosoma flavum TaxID=2048557 RepID=A0ABW6ADA1_9BACT
MKTFLFFILLVASQLGFAQPTSFSVTVTGKGQPVILIPGYSCSGEVWNETVAHLKDRYQCHVLTLPGFAGVAPIKTPILQTVRDEIIRYIKDKHLQKPILIGHSLGAFMGLWISSKEPLLISKLICVDGVPFISAMGNPKISADSLRKLPIYNADAVAQNFVNLPTDSYEANVAKSMLTQVKDSTRARQIAHWSALSDRRTLGYTLVEMSTTDIRKDISAIQAPTLVIGSLYFNSASTTERILNEQYALLKPKTILVAHTKHFIMYDDPTWFFGQIDQFLNASN